MRLYKICKNALYNECLQYLKMIEVHNSQSQFVIIIWHEDLKGYACTTVFILFVVLATETCGNSHSIIFAIFV
jgi:hypothetical protein